MSGFDLGGVIQGILFVLFADLTALVAAVIGPMYDNLLVPELAPGALFPPLYAASPASSNFLAPAVGFSNYLLGAVVDPLVVVIALGVAVLYLARATLSRWAQLFDGLLPRLVIAVVAANFAVPIGGAILGFAGALFPVVAGWGGGSWQHWVNLGGFGEIRLSWDNGALAFVLSLVEFFLVFGLVLAIGVRDALLAVLLVVLPWFTLLWPFRPLASIARRAWLLFAELAFLPCVLVVPLELAVGGTSPVLLVGFLGAALASPFLLSATGSHFVALGFPGAGGTAQGAGQRGLALAPAAAATAVGPALGAVRETGAVGRAASAVVRAGGTASAPLAAPLAVRELLGHGALGLARHWNRAANAPPSPRTAPLRPRGAG